MTVLEDDFERMQQHLFADATVERAGYLLVRLSQMDDETRLLVRDFFPVRDEDVKIATPTELLIDRRSYVDAMQLADRDCSGLVFVHSHPSGPLGHSARDNEELPKLFAACRIRIHHEVIHASIVFAGRNELDARVWLEDGTCERLDLVRVIGNRFRFFFTTSGDDVPHPNAFDRQVRAFGADMQRVLARLHVGIAGYGGTGSAVGEQLIRLGLGKVTTWDPDAISETNLTRLYGSRVADLKHPKVAIAERLAKEVGLGTTVSAIPKAITYEDSIRQMRACDVVFCCTDDQWGRSILAKFASYYLIPVLDVGVKVPSTDGLLGAVAGRVSVLKPGSACVFCTRRVTPERITAQSETELNPSLAAARRTEGYAPELGDPDPSVIFLTTAVAATAVTEFFARLTGFGSAERSDEILHRFSDMKMSHVSRVPHPDCFCGHRKWWARGDVTPLLDLTWRKDI